MYLKEKYVFYEIHEPDRAIVKKLLFLNYGHLDILLHLKQTIFQLEVQGGSNMTGTICV